MNKLEKTYMTYKLKGFKINFVKGENTLDHQLRAFNIIQYQLKKIEKELNKNNIDLYFEESKFSIATHIRNTQVYFTNVKIGVCYLSYTVGCFLVFRYNASSIRESFTDVNSAIQYCIKVNQNVQI